jgi:hypothetical protein
VARTHTTLCRSLAYLQRMISTTVRLLNPAARRSSAIAAAVGSSPSGNRPTSNIPGTGALGPAPPPVRGSWQAAGQHRVDPLEAAERYPLVLNSVLRTRNRNARRGFCRKGSNRGLCAWACHREEHDLVVVKICRVERAAGSLNPPACRHRPLLHHSRAVAARHTPRSCLCRNNAFPTTGGQSRDVLEPLAVEANDLAWQGLGDEARSAYREALILILGNLEREEA